MPSFLHKFLRSSIAVPFVLILVTLLAYGLFATQQGFHWDDWGFVWGARFGGNERLYYYFSVARPVLAYLYMVTLRLLGPNPLVWQVFALFWRASAAVAMWWALNQVWRTPHATVSPPSDDTAPKAIKTSATPTQATPLERRIFWVTLLTLLYPGFSQHSIAIAYGHYSLLFTVFWLSVGLMLKALRAEKRKWLPMTTALILSAWSLFSAEYAFGLELLRPVFLWFAMVGMLHGNASARQRLKRATLAYIPYFILLATFITWRVFIFGFQMYQAELFQSSGTGELTSLSLLPRTVFGAILTAAWQAWAAILDFSILNTFSAKLLPVYLVILISSFILLLFMDTRFGDEGKYPAKNRLRDNPNLPWIALGLLGLLSAGIPFYVANLEIRLGFPNDRYLMSFAFAAASLLVGLIGLLPKPDYRAVALSLIVALSMGKQIQYGHAFREDWERQKSFFWQLTWRAPQIEPDTLLLSDDSAIRFSVDASLNGPLNWIYNPDNPQGLVEYAYYFISTRMDGGLPASKPKPSGKDWYPPVFHGSIEDALVLQFQPPACLHILDPRYDSEIPAPPNSIEITRDLLADGVPVLTMRTLQALSLSDPSSRIPTDPKQTAHPPAFLFGKEIPHTWCYYYQKAALARQSGNWALVSALGDEVFAIPYLPNDAAEYLPFIEAYLHMGRIEDAFELTSNANRQMPMIAPALCTVWQRVKTEMGNAIPDTDVEGTLLELKYCPVN